MRLFADLAPAVRSLLECLIDTCSVARGQWLAARCSAALPHSRHIGGTATVWIRKATLAMRFLSGWISSAVAKLAGLNLTMLRFGIEQFKLRYTTDEDLKGILATVNDNTIQYAQTQL